MHQKRRIIGCVLATVTVLLPMDPSGATTIPGGDGSASPEHRSGEAPLSTAGAPRERPVDPAAPVSLADPARPAAARSSAGHAAGPAVTPAVSASSAASVAGRSDGGAGRAGAPRALPYSLTGDPRALGARVFRGAAFDTCHTPPYDTMRAWRRASPFRAVGVYIGGRGRACPRQPNLTPDWVRGVDRMGWRLLPLYVGSQAPCVTEQSKRRVAIGRRAPRTRGVREGRDAVRRVKALGMAPRSAIYLDMEAYDSRRTRCAKTTLRFVRGWSAAVRRAGYLPGFYSSSESGIAHMERVRREGSRDLPMALWFARWGVRPSVEAAPALRRTHWWPHRRAHQFQGNVKRTYGGRTLHIDRNEVDAPVAIIR
ncbi:DUF1906 domain-containing protein [Streptomyces sp. AJS327]|uniref:DUF1906 domain-containing protein n=1 Tax=Streptomyces sp. AJS327 TaxID=2545265 RepID=UPI0015DE68FC|nr:DUF1906 domain-containing protein [Streptomyces sp. AJS327]MBA0052711.1 DUF1906 domain-containing protein [Streptomyces sp. AJS327]